MTEVLPRDQESDPTPEDTAEDYPPIDVQLDFFRQALVESEDTQTATRLLRGPLATEFTELMTRLDHKTRCVDADFTPEYIMPYGYQSHWVQSRLSALGAESRQALADIKDWRKGQINLIHQEVTGSWLADQSLPDGILAKPEFASQVDAGGTDTTRACTSACFRMVFGAITGWIPSQKSLSEPYSRRYGQSVVDDKNYFKVYQTDVFQEMCDKTVVTLEMIGADFASIGQISTKMKQKHPNAQVYCTVNLASNTAGVEVWHTAVLLNVQNGVVTYHDPVTARGAHTTSTVNEFARRWAFAYNRAVLTIAV